MKLKQKLILMLCPKFNYSMLWLSCKKDIVKQKIRLELFRSVPSRTSRIMTHKLIIDFHQFWLKKSVCLFRVLGKFSIVTQKKKFHRDIRHCMANQSAPKTNWIFLGNGTKLRVWVCTEHFAIKLPFRSKFVGKFN